MNRIINRDKGLLIADQNSLKTYDTEKKEFIKNIELKEGGIVKAEVDPQRPHFIGIAHKNQISLVDTRENQ